MEEDEKKDEEEQEKEPESEEHREPEYATALNDLKTEYENKLKSTVEEFNERIKERDDIIKSLTLGERDDAVPSVSDSINAKRKKDLKKW